MPRLLDLDWGKIEREFVTGKANQRMIAEKYKISRNTVAARCWKHKWRAKRQHFAARVEAKLTGQLVVTIADKAASWAEEQWSRCSKFRTKIDESLEMAGGPLDPQALDQLTKAEQRVDDMGRRSLGLVDPRALDITSGGMPLEGFQSALSSVRTLLAAGGASSKELDLDQMAAEPLDPD